MSRFVMTRARELNLVHLSAIAVVMCFYVGLAVVALDRAFVPSNVSTASGGGSLSARSTTGDDVGGAAGGTTDDGVASDSSGEGSSGSGGATRQTADGTGTSPSAGTAGGPRMVAGVPGITATTMRIGIRYVSSEGTGAFSSAIGLKGVAPGDTNMMAQAMVNELNASGGIAGHKIDPFFMEYDTAKVAAGSAASEHQRHCEAFVNDGKVFAVVSPIPAGSLMAQCLGDNHVPYVQDSVGWYHDDDLMASLPDYYTPAAPNASRAARLWVQNLNAQGYFDKGAKLGLVRLGDPVWNRVVKEDLEPALRAIGQPIAEAIVITDPQQLGAGVLKFRTENVTHVLVMDDNGLLSTLWMNQAENQGYRPRYGLNSINAPELLEFNAPPAQLARSLGVGWARAYDVGNRSPTDQVGAEDKRCADIMVKHGVSLEDRTGYSVALYTCDVFFFLKTAVEGAPELSPAGIQASVAALGSSYRPTGTYSATFGRTRHDGVSAVRRFAYRTDCSCFAYTSDPTEAP